jgi:methylase of polypeptide subunit release factors
MTKQEAALLALGRRLKNEGYRFVTPTPETVRRVNARPCNELARSLHDVFGWSRRFQMGLLPENVVVQLSDAGALEREGEFGRSLVRCSSLNGSLYFHSAYPTQESDAVFFGPDTYRFCRLIAEVLQRSPRHPRARVLDLGCGTGAGGLSLLRHLSSPPLRLVLADINARCCSFSRVNATIQNADVEVFQSDLYAAISGEFDLIVANPPYLTDPLQRLYRDGGGSHGAALSLRILGEGLSHLAPGGKLVLYTASAIAAGDDMLLDSVREILGNARCRTWDYFELDPDVFGEELEMPPYHDIDRIAAVGLIVQL